MRVEFDADACTGHGRCYAIGPEFYDADDDGYCVDPTGTVPAGLEAAARRGAENCPENAITIVE
ncbi:MAG: ferredoxin [Acidimicrobiales bacterium]|jgi:ferredoxin|nr:ferredoxin [Acidimicrobiales bacterium]